VKRRKGRYLKDGKFEIQYGFNDKVVAEAPPEELVSATGEIWFVRPDRDNHYPAKWHIDKSKIIVEPALSNALKVNYANSVKEANERFKEIDKLAQYAPYIAILIGFFIVGIAWYVSTDRIAGEFGQAANALHSVANELKNASITIAKPPA